MSLILYDRGFGTLGDAPFLDVASTPDIPPPDALFDLSAIPGWMWGLVVITVGHALWEYIDDRKRQSKRRRSITRKPKRRQPEWGARPGGAA